MCKEIIFWQNYLFHSSKEVFLHNFREFWKIEFLKEYRQARTLQKWWKFVLSQFVLRKYFLTKLFVPVIKESFCPQFYAIFGKLNFWRNIDRRGLYKNGEICIILICAKKIFFGKIIYSTHQRKCFFTMLGNFWKIEFLKEYRQAWTLQKWWKFLLSYFVVRKYFLAKLFIPLFKRSVSPQF